MHAPNPNSRFNLQRRTTNTYNNGQPYRPARGRYAPRESVEDHGQSCAHPVIDLRREQPTAERFLQVVVRELKIRCYKQKSIKNYRNEVSKFLRWFGAAPHLITIEDVRNYLEMLIDGGAHSSTVATILSAIRTLFDKLCGASITLGLATPRRPKKLPVVLNRNEVARLLEAANSLHDKLLFGLMYATGVRVSEVVRLRWRDFDFERLEVNVWEGKGRTDRIVMLPKTFRHLLENLSLEFAASDHVFPSPLDAHRYLNPDTVRRRMKKALRLAGIAKKATPHSLRHGFACHMLEDGTDIRFIQQFLGHVRLETTTIYLKMARPRAPLNSPLDNLYSAGQVTNPIAGLDNVLQSARQRSAARKPTVGRLRLHMRKAPEPGETTEVQVTIEITSEDRSIYLTGIRADEPRKGWLNLQIPPIESWKEPFRWLTPGQRERIESPEFYELIQSQIRDRYHKVLSESG